MDTTSFNIWTRTLVCIEDDRWGGRILGQYMSAVDLIDQREESTVGRKLNQCCQTAR